MEALEGDHRQLEGDSLANRKPVKLTQNWSDVVRLLSSGHDTRCCILDSLQFRQQAFTDPVQQTVAVIKTTADECTSRDGLPVANVCSNHLIATQSGVELL